MSKRFLVQREVLLPDLGRVEGFRRAPEVGPQLLFFSGGSAIRELSGTLKSYTHNSIHLMTPFDSGGSSAKLREAFSMLSLGDLRSRLVSLADETHSASFEVKTLFAHRLPEDAEPMELLGLLKSKIDGEHPLVCRIPAPMRRLIQTDLRLFSEHMPPGFDLRGASIGNLLLAGGYLHQGRDIESVLYLFSKLLEVRGEVRPVVDTHAHLRARLADGRVIVGQSRLTAKEESPLDSPIAQLDLVEADRPDEACSPVVDAASAARIAAADLICYPMGSFYTSVLANLLPKGVGKAIAKRRCPKVFVPSTGVDPELVERDVAACVEELLIYLRRDAGEEVETWQLLDAVLVDEREEFYPRGIDRERIEAAGVQVIPLRLVEGEEGLINSRWLAEVLLSLS